MNSFEQLPRQSNESQESHEEPVEYLYHRVPDNLVGDTLYPLNELRETHPDVYELAKSKYEGREEITEKTIPIGDSTWNDALQFTTVHPHKIKEALLAAGAQLSSTEWYQIPVSLLKPDHAVIGFYSGDSMENFKPVSEESLKESATLPETTKQYYREQLANGERPFLFHGIPHIFYKGSILLKDCTKITV
ncbi:MAG: hypothetical protein A3C02_00670 [Candidatus Andersenbacteria bacterium RIFCSPHIGHO2_02_FULL_45_11]|uniref:Uncharacterized protein n=1 Tax=Candidatus Andersenbacteria bacterium RIFCSPHIGHO2_12_FULL_45_11 TaxID=1797281 RepID=A0A1G1X3B4_9BACT|nr:MAG: hypothetical protein A2805_02395 [Candidatus Andersenbacteria bacterium RIFCSPHIGHO2_01_FULL_46_36]OGY32900.1 MAG: hypothetical protein A3C02_00670 [Candidatus Andersenbacteria bacterium RIFCSPHIGHO2_02_FULL_45_11]OGY34060.1 MAG: hypothetical protein A3D99_02275 [Candidatus Andersenbacteria bacterium RIFCSPHIGHO2_12_FULL_45_11]